MMGGGLMVGRNGVMVLALVTATGCGSGSSSDQAATAGGVGSSRAEMQIVQRYRSDAGVVFRAPAEWSVHGVSGNAAIAPPGVTFDPQRPDNNEVYLILGTEDATDLDSPGIITALEALLAADNLRPQGTAEKITLDAGGRPARRFAWRGPTVPSGPLALHAYLVREGPYILILMAAAGSDAMSRHDARLRDVAASLDYDPAGTKFADARPASGGAVPPTPTPDGGRPGTAITGTWTGRLTGQADTIDDAQFKFSPAGNLIYEYRIRGGEVRSVEWTSIGQKVQYIPPNGGVQTITVEALERGPGRLSVSQRWVLERSGNILEQTFLNSRFEGVLTAAGLQVTVANATERYMNGNPVGTEQETYTGVLKPAR
jgi:hypothetical protein